MQLQTKYLGYPLPHPVIASASPLTKHPGGVARLAEAGAAAVVLHSLFEEQITAESEALAAMSAQGAESFSEAGAFFPQADSVEIGPEEYLELIRRSRKTVDIPVIASLNGATDGGWTSYAKRMEEAGASAIELNLFALPVDLEVDGRTVEDRYVHIVESVRHSVRVPVAVKLSPYFSATGSFCARLVRAGADGLVLFNRFYQPDFDLATLDVVSSLRLSDSDEVRLPLLWIAVLAGRVRASLAATSGVHRSEDAVKYLLAGADAVMTTSALLKHGPEHLRTLVDGIREWGDRRGYDSLAQLKGSMSYAKTEHGSHFERANYIKLLGSWKGPSA